MSNTIDLLGRAEFEYILTMFLVFLLQQKYSLNIYHKVIF